MEGIVQLRIQLFSLIWNAVAQKIFNKIDVLDSIISYTSFHQNVDFRIPPSLSLPPSFPISPFFALSLPSSPSLPSYLILPLPAPFMLHEMVMCCS